MPCKLKLNLSTVIQFLLEMGPAISDSFRGIVLDYLSSIILFALNQRVTFKIGQCAGSTKEPSAPRLHSPTRKQFPAFV